MNTTQDVNPVVTDVTDPVLDPVLKQIIQLADLSDNLAVVWLYGSRAKGNDSCDSDYDLAVAFKRFPKDAWDKRLQPELLQQSWSDKLSVAGPLISIVDINHIPLPLAYSIVQQGKALWVKDPLRLVREENRITSMWEVDYLWHEQHYG